MNNIYSKCKICMEENKECNTPDTCKQLSPNYDHKKVMKYMRMFQQAQKISQDFLIHQTPIELNLTEEELNNVDDKDKKKFIIPTTLQIKQKNPPELYVLIMEHDVQLRERNGFMTQLAKHIAKQTTPYQQTFQEYIEVYAKNRMLNKLAQHEQWKTEKAVHLNIELEDYINAYITTQILFAETQTNVL